MRVLGWLLLCVLGGPGVLTAQPTRITAEDNQRLREEIERLQNRYSRSKLVGPDSDLAMELPNGDLVSLKSCRPPVRRGGLILVDCTDWDGPAHFFDDSTRSMVQSCSFWFPDPRRCRPKQWGVDVPGCDGAVPEGITGTWRYYAMPGRSTFVPVPDGRTVTLTEGSITFDVRFHGPVERRYEVLRQDGGRYSLEMRDDRSAASAIQFELAPCGAFIESESTCDAFCENFADEIGVPNEEQIKAYPIFPERAFFVREGGP